MLDKFKYYYKKYLENPPTKLIYDDVMIWLVDSNKNWHGDAEDFLEKYFMYK